jgi:hypothetical protein
MTTTAEFLIAQYLRDPIRREPKNVGLIVIKDGAGAGKFLGEESGRFDLRTVRWASEPYVYQHWIEAWREEISMGADGLASRLAETNGENYQIVVAGRVTDTNGDDASTICDRLFPLLVAEHEPVALSATATSDDRQAEHQQSDLRKQVTNEFKNIGILARVHNPPRNPVYTSTPVMGLRVAHRPSYFQSGPVPHVMEVINFNTVRRRPVQFHAGWAAKMFDDIRARDSGRTRRVAIIRATPDDLQDKIVQDSIALLTDSIDERVDWNDQRQRTQFLEARREAAYATSV